MRPNRNNHLRQFNLTLNLGWINTSLLLNQAVAAAKASNVAVVFVGQGGGRGFRPGQHRSVSRRQRADLPAEADLSKHARLTLPWESAVLRSRLQSCGMDDERQLRTGQGMRPPLPVRADRAGADLKLEI